jgi:hypothetical protein
VSFLTEWALVTQLTVGGYVMGEVTLPGGPYEQLQTCVRAGRDAPAPPAATVIQGVWTLWLITCKPIHVSVDLSVDSKPAD